MTALRFLCFALLSTLCLSDDVKEAENVGEPMKEIGGWFKGISDGLKDTAENGMDGLKKLSENGMDGLKKLSADSMEKSEEGAETVKGWGEDIGDSFSSAREKLMETGEKMKEAVGDAALNTKQEIETAASKLSKHTKDISETMMKMLG